MLGKTPVPVSSLILIPGTCCNAVSIDLAAVRSIWSEVMIERLPVYVFKSATSELPNKLPVTTMISGLASVWLLSSATVVELAKLAAMAIAMVVKVNLDFSVNMHIPYVSFGLF